MLCQHESHLAIPSGKKTFRMRVFSSHPHQVNFTDAPPPQDARSGWTPTASSEQQARGTVCGPPSPAATQDFSGFHAANIRLTDGGDVGRQRTRTVAQALHEGRGAAMMHTLTLRMARRKIRIICPRLKSASCLEYLRRWTEKLFVTQIFSKHNSTLPCGGQNTRLVVSC